jgi:hypothetical protein
MDLANDRLVDGDVRRCDLVDERESLSAPKDLQRLLAREAIGGIGQQLFNLQVVETVPFDACCAMDRSNPCSAPEPCSVQWVDRKVPEDQLAGPYRPSPRAAAASS